MAANIKKLQVVFPEGKVLFDEGETSKEMYILLKGEVTILKHNKFLAKINANGSFIGEMATLLDAPRTAKVMVTQKSVFLRVEPEDVDVLFKVTPELGYSLSRSLAERLAIMTEIVSQMQSGEAPSAPPKEESKSNNITQNDLEAAKKAVQTDSAPKGPDLKFLTRTEVHKDVFRYYFNHLEMDVSIEDIVTELEFPDTLVKLILREFQNAGLIKVNEGSAHFNFLESFQDEVENWIFSHGLFRHAG
jgi:CRP-like cAMP-binding protein